MGFFKIGSQELFAQAGFELWGLQAWVTNSQLVKELLHEIDFLKKANAGCGVYFGATALSMQCISSWICFYT
jgi:hypothetical protein